MAATQQDPQEDAAAPTTTSAAGTVLPAASAWRVDPARSEIGFLTHVMFGREAMIRRYRRQGHEALRGPSRTPQRGPHVARKGLK
jgi:hypothetical protein